MLFARERLFLRVGAVAQVGGAHRSPNVPESGKHAHGKVRPAPYRERRGSEMAPDFNHAAAATRSK